MRIFLNPDIHLEYGDVDSENRSQKRSRNGVHDSEPSEQFKEAGELRLVFKDAVLSLQWKSTFEG